MQLNSHPEAQYTTTTTTSTYVLILLYKLVISSFWNKYSYLTYFTLYFTQEIIQNAEDAGASEMKILYDARPAVQEPSTKKAPFRKYFKVN